MRRKASPIPATSAAGGKSGWWGACFRDMASRLPRVRRLVHRTRPGGPTDYRAVLDRDRRKR
jgi:hypothetical protein